MTSRLNQYLADTYHEISLKKLDGTFTNGNVGVQFYDDGRLKGINSTQAGQGGAIIKAALPLLLAAAGPKPDLTAECVELGTINNKEPVTVKYFKRIDFTETENSPFYLDRVTFDKQQFDKIKEIFGDAVKVNYSTLQRKGICHPNDENDCMAKDNSSVGEKIALREPAEASFTVEAGPQTHKITFPFTVLVPQKGRRFTVPIQKPPVFGTQSFEIALNEAGKVTSIKYGKDSGIAAALTAVSDSKTAFESETTAEKAAAIKAEADLIAMQQRLVRCKADPKNCK